MNQLGTTAQSRSQEGVQTASLPSHEIRPLFTGQQQGYSNSMEDRAEEISPSNQQPEVVRLDNQAIHVDVHLATARFTVRDLVAGAQWRMDPYISESGRLVFSSRDLAGGNITYLLGGKGDHGVRFHHKFSYIRSDAEDDYSSLTLEGALGSDKKTQVEIEFLLSEAFPTLDLLLRVYGDARDKLLQISFPVGMAATVEESASLILPQSSERFLSQPPAKIAAQFDRWRPSLGHVSHGLSFFAISKQSRIGRCAGCLGFLNVPHAEIDVRADETLSVATPGTRNVRGALNDWKTEYRFQYQFVPDATPEAIAWLCREHVLQQLT